MIWILATAFAIYSVSQLAGEAASPLLHFAVDLGFFLMFIKYERERDD